MGTAPVQDTDFQSQVLESNSLVLVDFWADWCGPCKALGPKLEELAESDFKDKVLVAKLNVDQNPETAAKYSIRSIPTMMLFKAGEVVDQAVGNLSKEELVKWVEPHL